MDWSPQQLLTALQAAAGVFCFCFRHAPFEKGVFLSLFVNIGQYLVNFSQYLSILTNIDKY